MKDVDYYDWIDYFETLIKKFSKIRVKKILDLGCGTGIPTMLLRYKGYIVVGVDKSKEMLEVARSKARGIKNVKFVEGDFVNFNLKEEFDAAVSVFDSLNNLIHEEQLLKTFKNVRRHLKSGGPFVFDLNTEYALREYWGNGVKVFDSGKILSIWRTTFRPDRKISRLHITVFYRVGENTYTRMDEEHFERAYNNETIEELLEKSGFSEIQVFEHLSFSKPGSRTPRVVFVAV